MDYQKEKIKLKEQLNEEIVKWQTKLDEAKLQVHLGTKEARDKIEPMVNELELKYEQARRKLEELDDATENAWMDIKEGLQSSLKSMSDAFNKAKQHFNEKD